MKGWFLMVIGSLPVVTIFYFGISEVLSESRVSRIITSILFWLCIILLFAQGIQADNQVYIDKSNPYFWEVKRLR